MKRNVQLLLNMMYSSSGARSNQAIVVTICQNISCTFQSDCMVSLNAGASMENFTLQFSMFAVLVTIRFPFDVSLEHDVEQTYLTLLPDHFLMCFENMTKILNCIPICLISQRKKTHCPEKHNMKEKHKFIIQPFKKMIYVFRTSFRLIDSTVCVVHLLADITQNTQRINNKSVNAQP